MAPYSTSFKFDSVYVFDSIPDDDLGGRTGQSLFEKVLKPLEKNHDNFKAYYFEVMTWFELSSKLKTLDQEIIGHGRGPIIHIEAHGNISGIKLVAEKEEISWSKLSDELTLINKHTRFNLLLVLGLCNGFNFIETLLPTKPAPVWAIVGPKENVWSGELFDSLTAFYAVDPIVWTA